MTLNGSIRVKNLRPSKRVDPLSRRGGKVKVGKWRHIGRCFAILIIVIRHNDDIVLCYQDGLMQYKLGHVSEGLMNVWEKTRVSPLTYRELYRLNKQRLHICKECGYGVD